MRGSVLPAMTGRTLPRIGAPGALPLAEQRLGMLSRARNIRPGDHAPDHSWFDMRMTAITVRTLGEDDWDLYRKVRLAALAESPEAFAATASGEREVDESEWRSRMNRSRRLLAENEGGEAIGVCSLRTDQIEGEEVPFGELFGLWVNPEARGTGVAVDLLEAALAQARKDNLGAVIYWVGTDNAAGVAFASSHGFRPTDHRRPMNPKSTDTESTEEAAMVYPLASDPSEVPSSALASRP